MTLLAIADLLKLVRIGLTSWQQIKAAWGQFKVEGESGQPVSLDDLEPHVIAAEAQQQIAAVNAGKRIDARHQGES